MRRLAFLAVAVTALLLTSCAIVRSGGEMASNGIDPRTPPTPCKVKVHFVQNNIIIDHEPVRISRCTGPRRVEFQIAGNGTFASDGVALKSSDPSVDCQRDSDKQFTCTFGPKNNSRHPYTIKIIGANEALDPMMIND